MEAPMATDADASRKILKQEMDFGGRKMLMELVE